MLAVTYEVAMRYIFNRPTTWSMEINQFLFCAIVALGGAYTLSKEGHVSVDILYNHLKPRAKAIASMVTSLLLFAFCNYRQFRILKEFETLGDILMITTIKEGLSQNSWHTIVPEKQLQGKLVAIAGPDVLYSGDI